MRMCEDASASTVHRRLKTLRLKGMLDLQLDEDDNRVKYIVPTELANAYITALGQSVVMAAGSFTLVISNFYLITTKSFSQRNCSGNGGDYS